MRPILPDFTHDAKRRILALLTERGSLPLSEAAAIVMQADTVPPALAAKLVKSVIGDDQRIRITSDNRLELTEILPQDRLADLDFVILDVETTGLKAPADRITELGAIRLSGGKVTSEFCTLINPEREIPFDIIRTTGITNEMVADKPTSLEVMPRFADWLGDTIVVAHNAWFDRSFVDQAWLEVFGEPVQNTWLCSVKLSRKLYPHFKSRSLGPLCEEFGITYGTLHRAGDDARATAEVFLRILDDLAARGIETLDGLTKLTKPVPYKPRKSSRHTIGGWRKDEFDRDFTQTGE